MYCFAYSNLHFTVCADNCASPKQTETKSRNIVLGPLQIKYIELFFVLTIVIKRLLRHTRHIRYYVTEELFCVCLINWNDCPKPTFAKTIQ